MLLEHSGMPRWSLSPTGERMEFGKDFPPFLCILLVAAVVLGCVGLQADFLEVLVIQVKHLLC